MAYSKQGGGQGKKPGPRTRGDAYGGQGGASRPKKYTEKTTQEGGESPRGRRNSARDERSASPSYEGGRPHRGGFQRDERSASPSYEGGRPHRGGFQRDERSASPSYEGGRPAPQRGGFQRDDRPARHGGFTREERPVPRRGDFKRDDRPAPRGDFAQRPAYEQKHETQSPAQPPVQAPFDQTLPYFLMGRNAVKEAIKKGRSIDRILVVPDQDGSLREIVRLAKDRGLVIRETDRKKLDELCMPFGHNNRPGNHQGIVAMVPDVEYVSIEDILAHAKSLDEAPFVLVLDEINDPHNLGSILRSAACAGVHGVLLPKRRNASVTSAVAKISAGAVEHVLVGKVGNITNAIATLKKAGLWIAGADAQGSAMDQADMKGPLALVIGNESTGLSRLVREKCDFLVAVPMRSDMDSLNAAVAAAVLMFEKNRQDR